MTCRRSILVSVAGALILAGCSNPTAVDNSTATGSGDSNQPPYPVKTDEVDEDGSTPDIVDVDLFGQSLSDQFVNIYVETDGSGDADPDGDAVSLAWSTLPSYMTVEVDPGDSTQATVVIEAGTGATTDMVRFWSVDSAGNDTEADALQINFRIGSSS